MKVISGFLKGRKILGYDIDGTRPTMDRVKESLFASIQFDIENSVVLDLFAGSGNLGIEAISNGSDKVYFNDLSKEAIKVINKNIAEFDITDKSIVLNLDYRKCLEHLFKNGVKFDIVFLDPPYKLKVINEIIEYILENNMLLDSGLIICEMSDNYLNDYEELEVRKQKRYGDKEVIILKEKVVNE